MENLEELKSKINWSKENLHLYTLDKYIQSHYIELLKLITDSGLPYQLELTPDMDNKKYKELLEISVYFSESKRQEQKDI